MGKRGKVAIGILFALVGFMGYMMEPIFYPNGSLLFFCGIVGFTVWSFFRKRKKGLARIGELFLFASALLLVGGGLAQLHNQVVQHEKTETKSKEQRQLVPEQIRGSQFIPANEKTLKHQPQYIELTHKNTKKHTKKVKKARKQKSVATTKATGSQPASALAALDYAGTQTIEVNNGIPSFTTQDLDLSKGAWELYGNLDSQNRVTAANALLNKSLMPTGKRTDISGVRPTGWKNKKIKKGYLYNRSHLIGWALAGENANPKNLMTGTQQLNNPEMLRFEMDIKTYLEQDAQHFVRYRVTPIFRGNELLARGVQLEAKSLTDTAINLNVYIFNIEDGVQLNYADGTSSVIQTSAVASSSSSTSSSTAIAAEPHDSQNSEQVAPVVESAALNGEQQYVDANGNGLIKGSRNGIYHLPGSTYYNRTTNPAAWFKTISEAENAGYRPAKR